MEKKSWFSKIILTILLGIGGMILGALLLITVFLVFIIEVLFRGLQMILI